MEVGDEHDLQLRDRPGGLVDGDVVGGGADDAGIDHPAHGHGEDGQRAQAAHQPVDPRLAELLHVQQLHEDEPAEVRQRHGQQQVQQDTQPVVADELHGSPRLAVGQQEGDEGGEGEEGVNKDGDDPRLFPAQSGEP